MLLVPTWGPFFCERWDRNEVVYDIHGLAAAMEKAGVVIATPTHPTLAQVRPPAIPDHERQRVPYDPETYLESAARTARMNECVNYINGLRTPAFIEAEKWYRAHQFYDTPFMSQIDFETCKSFK